MNAVQAKKYAMRGLLVACVATLIYGIARFESIRLPSNGCSPVHGVEPGARLVLDTWAQNLGAGELVLYRDAAGVLYLGRVQPFPANEESGSGLWVLGDRSDCPTRDSRDLGPIDTDRIAGRIFYVHS